jgi:hypothetical protein
MGMLGILVRLVLVEGIDDLADQIALGIFPKLLSYRHQIHADAAEFSNVA